MPAFGLVRAARACALGATTLSLAALAHAAAGGRLPSPEVLGTVVLLVAVISTLVTRWRMSRTGAVALLGGGQVVLHEVLLAASSHSGGADPAEGSGGQPGGSSAAPLTALLTSTARHLATHQADSPIPASAMLAAHAAATVLTGLALAHGDDLLWAVWGWLQPLPAALVASVVPVPPRPYVLPPRLEILPQGVVLTEHIPRRGPPARSTAPLPLT
jgi:hypothetical protein